jgi:hypothetical protein
LLDYAPVILGQIEPAFMGMREQLIESPLRVPALCVRVLPLHSLGQLAVPAVGDFADAQYLFRHARR